MNNKPSNKNRLYNDDMQQKKNRLIAILVIYGIIFVVIYCITKVIIPLL